MPFVSLWGKVSRINSDAEHKRSTEAEYRAILLEVLIKPRRNSFAEALAKMPDIGTDADFERINDDAEISHVFD